jgi:hypothetical protein
MRSRPRKYLWKVGVEVGAGPESQEWTEKSQAGDDRGTRPSRNEGWNTRRSSEKKQVKLTPLVIDPKEG